ncbi:MAG: porin [Xanthobacteraceae bacterium]|nr:porin [Xanthobacteraceae bacterium]
MKMVKSAFLASAAGLVAMSGAQAADLPVKAKPVEYVKVCSLYGAGFFYMPGTDICLKIGGYVRYQMGYGGGSITAGPFSGAEGTGTRVGTHDFSQRVRTIATFDTRQQTAYGTLRTYLILGYTHDTNANQGSPLPAGALTPPYFTRGFIQIAGFTFGKATSFYDFASTAASAYNAGYLMGSSDTGDFGWIGAWYTAQLGNGVSTTFGIEQSRRGQTVYLPGATTATVFSGAFSSTANQGNAVNQTTGLPDVVGNIRVDQAWGAAQVAAAAHNVNASYYGIGTGGGSVGSPAFNEANGHPGDAWGWAVSGGLRLNAPMIGPGDYFQAQVNYTEGAIRYASGVGGTSAYLNKWKGNQFAFGQLTDATFSGTAAAGNSIDLTTAWSVFAAYEHFWTPSLRTSIYGSYLDVSYNASATAAFCARVASAIPGGGGAGCTPSFSTWQIGSRSQWNITKDLYVGVDVLYSKFQSASIGSSGAQIGTGSLPSGKGPGFYTNADQDSVNVTWRVHRDFIP